jgi:malonyl-CoA O-methyltransferase
MIAIPHKHRVARAFGRAQDYAAQAHVQRQAAEALADHILATAPAQGVSILEIGCGTGFLTEAVHARLGPAAWTITDIAPEMVARAIATLDIDGDYRVMDGEHPDLLPDARFDLIMSSLSFQWFADLPGAIARLAKLLRPGGLLAFSTMAAGSFTEWRAAHAALGLSPGTPAYPDEPALHATVPDGFTASIDITPFVQRHDDARAFLHQVKAIGAAVPAQGSEALSPAELRRVMAAYDAGPRTATYRIAFCLFRAPAIG